MLAHAHRLLRSTPQGATSYIDGNLAEPGPILD
ncbi:MAG: SAM-dependent methyltransferase, partial [Streptosporangiaceae bacterium]